MTFRHSLWLLPAVALLAAMPALAAEPPAPDEGEKPAATENLQPCRGAGLWFPDRAEDLAKIIDAALDASRTALPGRPVALIVPHAGYRFCAHVAGQAYAPVKAGRYERVLVFGVSHRVPLAGASVLKVDAYETPLGRLPVDTEARDKLLACPAVSTNAAAHASEHSVENQFPFIQRVAKDARVVEVLVGELSDDQRTALAAVVRGLLDDKTLLVVSSDFCHYGPNYGYTPFKENVPKTLFALNTQASQEIQQTDAAGWQAFLGRTGDTVCGRNAIALLLEVLAPMRDVEGRRLAYDTSGNVTGDYTNSVTYASYAFWHTGGGLEDAEKATLLRMARDAASYFLENGKLPEIPRGKYVLTPRLTSPGAAFVTLKNKGELRGCIGHVVAYRPLAVSVVENACNALRDPRFTANPITTEELPQLTIEISVLTPMRRLTDPEQVEVGKDGLMMVRGERRGLLLPQVPGEQGWDREQFLEGTCRKAGLAPDAWKDPKTEIYWFRGQVFGEGHVTAGKE